MKRGRADCGQFRARTRSGRALERGRGRARACPEEGIAASRSETDAEAPRGRHRDGRIGRAAESGGSEASRCCSDRASGRAPREVGTDAKIARSSRSAKRRTSTGDACTSPGDLQNMIPLSREVGRRAGARRSARARGRGRDERSRTDEAERSRASHVDAFHAAHLDRTSEPTTAIFASATFSFSQYVTQPTTTAPRRVRACKAAAPPSSQRGNPPAPVVAPGGPQNSRRGAFAQAAQNFAEIRSPFGSPLRVRAGSGGATRGRSPAFFCPRRWKNTVGRPGGTTARRNYHPSGLPPTSN